MMKRLSLVVSLLVVAVMILAACAPAVAPTPAATEAPKPAGPVTIWTKFNDTNPQNTQDQWLAQFIKDIKTDKDVTLTNVFVPYDQINSKINLAVQAGGDVPDVSYVDAQNLPFFVNNGTLMDITDYVKAAPWYSSVSEVALKACTGLDGKIYCVPNILSGGGVMYYWTAAFPNGAPKTTDDLLAAAEQFKKDGKFAYTFKGAEAGSMGNFWESVVYSFGGKFADEKGNLAWATPETVKAVEFVRKLYSEKYAPDVAFGPGFDNETPFKDGSAAVFNAGSWSYVYLNPLKSWKGTSFDKGAGSVDEAIKAGEMAVALPLSAPGGKPVSVAYISGFAIPTNAKNVAGAKAVIDYIMQSKQDADYAFAYGALPTVADSMKDPRFADSTYWQAVQKIFAEAGKPAALLANEKAYTKMAETLVNLIQKPDMDIMTALKAAQDEVNAGQ